MFGTSGLRGRVGEAVTGSLAPDVGRAFGSMTDCIVVGRDGRQSGDALARAVVAGAQKAGTDVLDSVSDRRRRSLDPSPNTTQTPDS